MAKAAGGGTAKGSTLQMNTSAYYLSFLLLIFEARESSVQIGENLACNNNNYLESCEHMREFEL